MERILCRRTIKRMMLDYGVTFIDPKNTYISEQASIGRDTVIYPNVTIEGETRYRRRLHDSAGNTHYEFTHR